MMSKGCVIFIDEIEQRSLEMIGNLPQLWMKGRTALQHCSLARQEACDLMISARDEFRPRHWQKTP
jgi:hypothetical protein